MLKPGETVVDHYVVKQKLGQGGFSQTFLVRDRDLPNYPLCVAKCFAINADAEIDSETVRHLFKREAQVLQKLGEHSSIPRLLAYRGERLCLIEEYMHGTPLLSDIRHQRYWNADAIVAMLQDVLTVLAFIHSQQIVHGDIKPSNLIRQPGSGNIAIVDFGSATSPDQPEAVHFGTPGYTAPEQAAGHPTFASDLYGLGITAIYLMSGIPPTELKRDPTGKLLWHPAQPHTLDLKLIPILDQLTDLGRDRYQRSVDVLADLELIEPTANADRLADPRLNQSLVTLNKQLKRCRRIGRILTKPMIVVAVIGTAIWYVRDITGLTKPVIAVISQHMEIGWHPLTLQHLHTVSIAGQPAIEQLVFTPNHLITRSDRITVWNAQTATPIRTLEPGSSRWMTMSASADGTWLATADRDRRVVVWDIASKRIIQSFVEPRPVVGVAISPDRDRIATIDESGTYRIRQISSGALVQSFISDADPKATVLFADADRVLGVSSNNRLHLWNVQSGELMQVLAGHTDRIALLQTHDGKIYSFGKDLVRVWGIDRAELLSVFTPNSGGIVAAQRLTDPDRLLSINQNGSLQLWNSTSGQLIQTIAQIKGTTALSTSGLIASSDSDQLQIWQVR